VPSVVFVASNGDRQEVAFNDGQSVMEVAVANGIRGIVGECGGFASCASCHVDVDPAFRDLLELADEFEEEMLDEVAGGRRPGSRLSCQIRMTPAICGLTVHLPESQN
jgi:2Fe-2S ferredoxin